MSPNNAQSAFRHTGIYPLNKESTPAESLIPAEVYKEDHENADIPALDENDSQATDDGRIIAADNDTVAQEETVDVFEIFIKKESQLKNIKCGKKKKK